MRHVLLILLFLCSLPAMAGYTKIANNGSALPGSAVLGTEPGDWACTRDDATGLLWEIKTSDGGLRDWNKTYTNYDDPTQPQKWNGSTYVTPTQAEIDAASNSIGLVRAVNATALCGQTDWRMPGTDELVDLLDRYSPLIYETYFQNTQPSYFWSGSPYTAEPSYGVAVSFRLRNVGLVVRGSTKESFVRLVRSGQSSGSSFTLSLSPTGNGSGTVSSNSGGINCSSNAGVTSGTCAASLASGTVVSLSATPTAGNSFTGWSGCDSVSGNTCTVTLQANRSISAGFTTGAASQSIAFGAPPNIVVGGTGTVSAIASSGLPVTLSSSTPSICSVSGSTVTGIASGTCTITADQSGNASYSPAPQATQGFTVSPKAPSGSTSYTRVRFKLMWKQDHAASLSGLLQQDFH